MTIDVWRIGRADGAYLDFGFGFSSPVWGRRERSADGSGLALDFPSPFDADMNWPV